MAVPVLLVVVEGAAGEQFAAAAPALRLDSFCWRHTFIDGPPEAVTCSLSPRADSEPGGCSTGCRNAEKQDFFKGERSYVAKLGARWTPMVEQVMVEQQTSDVLPDITFSRAITGVSDASTRAASDGADEPSSSDVSLRGSESSGPWVSKVKPVEERRITSTGAVKNLELETEEVELASASNQALADALLRAKEEDGPPPVFHAEELLEGSAGHPFLCSRPCLFFAQGHCPFGDTCQFCHRQHAVREFHVDKWNRELLHKMAFRRRVLLALPLLREKVGELDLGSDCEQLFRRLLDADPAQPSSAKHEQESPSPSAAPRRLRKLLAALQPQSVRAVLASLCYGLPPLGPERAAVAEVCRDLRALLAAHLAGNSGSRATAALQ